MSDLLFNRQFAQQEVLRTITLGLSPFIPFSQQYVMKMKTEQDNVEMSPDPPLEGQDQDSMWRKRKKDYFAQPEQSPREILDKAPRPNITELSKRLQNIFDTTSGDNPTVNKFDQSVVGEILSSVGEREISTILNELGTPIQRGIDSSPLAKQAPVGGQGFDRLMTDDMRTVIGAATGRNMTNVVAIEETEARVSKEVQEGLQGLSGEEAIAQFGQNVEKTYGNFNKTLKNLKLNQERDLVSQLDKARNDPFYAADSYSKQLLARVIDLTNAGLGDKEYLYTVPIGTTGMAGSIFLKSVVKNNRIQLQYDYTVTHTGGHGRLIELMGSGLSNINSKAGAGFIGNISAMDMEAMNASVLTADRVGYIGMMQEVRLSSMLDIGADISMTKNAGKGVTGLSSKAMADSLATQMEATLKDKKVQNGFANVYMRLIAKANQASALWKNKVSPPVEYMGSRGVWKMSGDNWRDRTGQDFSVSPFLMIRRKGVASFKPKNKARFL